MNTKKISKKTKVLESFPKFNTNTNTWLGYFKNFYQENRKMISIIIIIIILFIFFLLGNRKKDQETYIVKPIDVDYTILASCTVSEPAPYDMMATSGGVIKKINTKEGRYVKKNDVLVQVDDFKERKDLSISMDNLASVKIRIKNVKEEGIPRLNEQLNEDEAKLTNAKSYLARLESMDTVGGVTKVDLDQARANYQQAFAQYNQTKIQLDSYSNSGMLADLENQKKILTSQIDLAIKAVNDKRITAPYNGLIIKININEGETIQPNTAIMTIIEKRDWILETSVDQKELPFLLMFQPAQVVLDAYPGEKINAEVILICSSIDISKGSCDLKLRIKENRSFIKYGMTGNVEIYAKKYKNVLAIPSRFLEKQNGEGHIYVIEKKQTKKMKADYMVVGEQWIILKNISENTVLALPGK